MVVRIAYEQFEIAEYYECAYLHCLRCNYVYQLGIHTLQAVINLSHEHTPELCNQIQEYEKNKTHVKQTGWGPI